MRSTWWGAPCPARPAPSAKYLTLAGAPKPLYGQERVRGPSEVFVVEGPIDWLLLWQWGYPAVATLGNRIKREHVRKLSSAVPPLATPSTTGPSSSHWEVIETVCTSDSRFAFDDVLVTSANMYTCNAAVPSCVARRTKET